MHPQDITQLESWETLLFRAAHDISLTKDQYALICKRYEVLQGILNVDDEPLLAGAHIFVQGACGIGCGEQVQIAIGGKGLRSHKSPRVTVWGVWECSHGRIDSGLVPGVAAHQANHGLPGIKLTIEQRHHGLGNRHVHAQQPRSLHHGAGAINAFGHMAERRHRLRQGAALRQQQTHLAVA